MVDDTISGSLLTQIFYWLSLVGVIGGIVYLYTLKQYAIAGLVAMLSLLVHGVYWNSLLLVAEKWEAPEYSHGYLVAVFAIALLWMRWQPLGRPSAGAVWTGTGLVLFGILMRLGSAYYNFIIPDMVSIIPCLCGVFLMFGGWQTILWAWPAVGFLIFMFPWPDVLERNILRPLQTIATRASTFVLQTLGQSAYSDGNRIMLNEMQLGIVDACAGLRMLTIFLALAVAITLVTVRPLWERILIIVSAVPIALAVNVTRITATGILHLTVGEEIANKVFHDLAGWVMMPMALGLLYLELQLLSHLFIEDELTSPMQLGQRSAPAAAGPRA